MSEMPRRDVGRRGLSHDVMIMPSREGRMMTDEMLRQGAEALRHEGRGASLGGDGKIRRTGRPNGFTMYYYEEGPNASHSAHVTPEWLARIAQEPVHAAYQELAEAVEAVLQVYGGPRMDRLRTALEKVKG
jgi:hypothetical protein